MSALTPAPGNAGLDPTLVAVSLADDNSPPLLDLLQRFPDFFHKEVLERLDPTARASLAGTGSVFRDAVYPRSIFPFGLPALSTLAIRPHPRVFKLVEFIESVERLAWVGLGRYCLPCNRTHFE
jgi:hypothetical protein